MNPLPALSIAVSFEMEGRCLSIEPLGRGHIHQTFVASTAQARYVLQQINTAIFPDVPALMQNVERVSRHLSAVPGIETYRLVPTRSGAIFSQDAEGRCWRMLTYIENTHCFETVPDPDHAADAARLFARFHKALAQFPASDLNILLPGFHHTPQRFEIFVKAQEAAEAARAQKARPEIEFARAEGPALSRILQDRVDCGELPLRLAHNDTKINNVLFDRTSGKARAVIDLDTVMPGLWLHDIGDLIRTAATTAAEDEPDLERVRIDPSLLQALVDGYLEAIGDAHLPIERQLIIAAARVICFETGLRFLTDYLSGDRYFAVHRPEHNLLRCRTQFKLLRELGAG